MPFKNKRILFIGPKFHNYESLIINDLKKLGAEVDFFSERSYSMLFTFINNFRKKTLIKFQENHYLKILEEVKTFHYDYLFVIRGFMMPRSFLERFKIINPESKMIMYQWDSQRTNPFIHLKDLFDSVKTFDFADSFDYDLSYLPLFYTNDIKDLRSLSREEKAKYDFFFMGFFFDERYEAVLKFRDYCIENGFKLYAFLYMPKRTMIKYMLMFKKLDRSIVSFKPMSRDRYLNILTNSNVMVDVSNPRQTGLAMRVIESLACGTKVATNNQNITNDLSLLASNSIALFNLNQIKFNNSFLNDDIVDTAALVLSIEDWLLRVFSYES